MKIKDCKSYWCGFTMGVVYTIVAVATLIIWGWITIN